ncbi:MAG TPA: rhomboid family intramembrane serine protease [Terriglobia bacterium]|nr:rhomboid family intramembrane serine protease [Terriglobia bacterium]
MSSRYRSSGFGIGGRWTPAVKTLVIACVVGFLLQIFDRLSGAPSLANKFGLVPAEVTEKYYLWQLVTYIFLHGGFFHILFNMFGLYMFGSELEATWGTREFTKFFFLCGIGGALASVIVSPHAFALIIGASGAIFGLLVAYGVLFPNRLIYLYMIIPIQAKWFVIIYGAINLLSALSVSNSGVAYVTHLGGMFFGFVYLKGGRLLFDFRGRYDRWQRNRLRRKFEVYYNERRRDEDENKWRRWKN